MRGWRLELYFRRSSCSREPSLPSLFLWWHTGAILSVYTVTG